MKVEDSATYSGRKRYMLQTNMTHVHNFISPMNTRNENIFNEDTFSHLEIKIPLAQLGWTNDPSERRAESLIESSCEDIYSPPSDSFRVTKTSPKFRDEAVLILKDNTEEASEIIYLL